MGHIRSQSGWGLEELELGAHPGHDLHDDPGARLLQHGHGQVVRDALQGVAVHCQESVATPEKKLTD